MGFRIIDAWRAAGIIVVAITAAAPANALQCVPYARAVSGIELRGDAWRWWNAAAGIYDRGHAPRIGAVMVFRKFKKMQRGHVAVVARIVDRRQILVDHANWGPPGAGHGSVATKVAVRDVSRGNDWSEVQVWSPLTRDFGTHAYPTYGFIYPRDGAKGNEARTAIAALSTEMPEFVLAMLAMPQSSAAPPGVPPEHSLSTTEVKAELPAIAPGADAQAGVAIAEEDPFVPGRTPEPRQSANGIWEGDQAAARRARSGQYRADSGARPFP